MRTLLLTALLLSVAACMPHYGEDHSFGRARLTDLGVEVASVDTVNEQSKDALMSQPVDFQVKENQGAVTLQRTTFFLKNYLGKDPEFNIDQQKSLVIVRSKALDTNRICEVRRAESADMLRYRVGCVSSEGKRLLNLERSVAQFIQSGEMDLNVLD